LNVADVQQLETVVVCLQEAQRIQQGQRIKLVVKQG